MIKNDHFIKTGSGQNKEKLRKEAVSANVNVQGKGGLRFGAMEALATTDGQGQERGGWHAMIVDCDRKRVRYATQHTHTHTHTDKTCKTDKI
eukprot:COSAG06_NODE_21446_length_756_cov_1.176560_1_plen_92_part_00